MAASSKIVATLTTYPYQVLRARLQFPTEGKAGLIAVFKGIVKNEGIRGFYKGLFPNIVRVLPGTIVTFGVYEWVSDVFKRL